MTILVTGAAGFIGNAVALRLLERGDRVIGLDNLNPYYDVNLKKARLERLAGFAKSGQFTFCHVDLIHRESVSQLFADFLPRRVVHLAAQAGVRYSLENPLAYIDSNIVGFAHILEACRHHQIEHLVYASTSSVYGANRKLPFSVQDSANHPLSLYAATKKANELMAHTYSYLYNLPTTGLRFFTVYGPWGRPDMALFKFTKAILNNDPLPVFNYGRHQRDFTYIDDIVEGVVKVLDHPATANPHWNPENPDPSTSLAPWRLYNIGAHRPVELLRYIELLETYLGKKATLNLLPLQPGDVPDTYADVEALRADTGYEPTTPVEVGVRRFVDWYCEFYQIKL
ncbi:NAD-dependent epimerase [Thermosynechococcus sp.]|uniref:NAD-dependent epimerase n=1 Tax=Thermosynechococcus sp. TaxID=2814275 RepID=UPI0039197B51